MGGRGVADRPSKLESGVLQQHKYVIGYRCTYNTSVYEWQALSPIRTEIIRSYLQKCDILPSFDRF